MKNKDLFSLQDRVAIVTGGGGLLASEHAVALADFGAKVVLADFNLEKCKAAADNLKNAGVENVTAQYCDVTSKQSWTELLQHVLSVHGRVDILVNNAGFTNQSKSANFDASF